MTLELILQVALIQLQIMEAKKKVLKFLQLFAAHTNTKSPDFKF